MKRILTIILLFVMLMPLWAQQGTTEEVTVDYWVLPLFAVDGSGNPVLDLEEADIQLYLNKKRITNFSLHKRLFDVSEKKENIKMQVKKSVPDSNKNKIVFLLFDNVVSSRNAISLSKTIAKELVLKANPDTRFVVMSIEPNIGMVCRAGPTNNKKEILAAMEKKVVGKTRPRVPDFHNLRLNMGVKGGKYDGKDNEFFSTVAASRKVHDSKHSFNGYESLYYAINSIKDNKFIYLFTEGIPRGDLTVLPTLYYYYLQRMGRYLGRSGAVLFIVNSRGAVESMDSASSGAHALEFLAAESGGKYLEGTGPNIVESIQKMHRAYYEVSFPDLPGLKGNTRNITIKSNRKGTDIHSMRSIEKSKSYPGMSTIERELLVFNLITKNPLYKINMESDTVKGAKIKRKKNSVLYKIKLPDSFQNRRLLLYKYLLTKELDILNIERVSVTPTKDKMKILFDTSKRENSKTCFALVDESSLKVLTCAKDILPDEPGFTDEELAAHKKIKDKFVAAKRPPGSPVYSKELQDILAGTAVYCERLKRSAFHFTCTEKIVETTQPLNTSSRELPDISRFSTRSVRGSIRKAEKAHSGDRVSKHRFFYRLIKNRENIKEKREKFVDESENQAKNTSPVMLTQFLTQRPVFAPVTLLAPERQSKYRFVLKKYSKRKGRRCAIIETYPLEKVENSSIYGLLWIDCDDFSVVRIEANPESIAGLDELNMLARKLGAKLFLNLDIEFDKTFDGLRFPTRVNMVQKYKGGQHIRRFKGPKGWARNKTCFTYSGYQFFAVDAEVTSEDIGSEMSK
ncbi:MAG: hypothetical protein GY757_04955 [bacterium]|nr:hypothetical protein [bacterium]